VTMERRGYRVAKRRAQKSRIGVHHRVVKEDTMKWFQTKFDGILLGKGQEGNAEY